jgi:hypothetical protein
MRLFSVALALALAVSCGRQPAGNEIAASFHAEEVKPDFQAKLSGRPIFPFSVVPGGTLAPAEAKSRAAADPIVRQHYAGIQFHKLKPFRLTQPASGYVSFRVGNRIFWTAQRLYLKPGELVLSDGAQMIRGRCGNRISPDPQLPVLPGPEPAQAILETPVWDIPEYEALAADLFRRAGEIPLFVLPGNLPPSTLEPAASLPPQAYAVAPPPALISGPFPGAVPHPSNPGEIEIPTTYFLPVWLDPPVLEVPGFVVTPWRPILPPVGGTPFEVFNYSPVALPQPVLIAGGIPFLPGAPGGNLPVLIPPEWRLPSFPSSPLLPPLTQLLPPLTQPEVVPPGESNAPAPPPPSPEPETETPPAFEPIPEPGTVLYTLAAVFMLVWVRARLSRH